MKGLSDTNPKGVDDTTKKENHNFFNLKGN